MRSNIYTFKIVMQNDSKDRDLIKGRGAQYNPKNEFEQKEYVREWAEGIDEWEHTISKTEYINTEAKEVVNKVISDDVPMLWSINPYQGCEHGCVYCYARNTHQYWGYSAGADFESKIIVKQNAAERLRATFDKKSWTPSVISLSGNTDPYQPAERKHKITRELLKICLEYRNPVGIITKNALILRDLDILQQLQEKNLVQVYTSITSTDEKLRLKLEPRTSTYADRFKLLEILSKNNIPTGVMNAPIIPGLNDADMHDVLKQASLVGAKWAGYTIVRLNGENANIFNDWVSKTYPDRADKILNHIKSCHGGTTENYSTTNRMKGEGHIAEIIEQQFKLFTNKYNFNKTKLELNTKDFIRAKPGQMELF
jgi:DNA repair photolyase